MIYIYVLVQKSFSGFAGPMPASHKKLMGVKHVYEMHLRFKD